MENLEDFIREIKRIEKGYERVITGQKRVFRDILTAIISGGHVLMEGVPGVGKTLIVRTIAEVLGLSFRRLQFTPDLMPSDIIGVSVYDPHEMNFRFTPGPIFTDLLLADEINRSPARTQSALLEVMEERQVTVEGKAYEVSEFFTVIATQNPVEFEGTYPLPEAEVDRFIIKVSVGYPDREEELDLLKKVGEGLDPRLELERIEREMRGGRVRSAEERGEGEKVWDDGVEKEKVIESHPFDRGISRGNVAGTNLIRRARELVNKVKVQDSVRNYLFSIVEKTRSHPDIFLGASPRAGLHLLKIAKARALLSNRLFVTPDDVKESLVPVLSQRLLLNAEVELQGKRVEDAIEEISSGVPVPR